MKNRLIRSLFLTVIALYGSNVIAEAQSEKTIHGEYKDWRVLGVSHRLEKKYVRAILGNETAINAARNGKTSPWPDGTIIAKLSWKEQVHASWPNAVVPGEFQGAEAMIKDIKKYPETNGWAFARWEGANLMILDKEKTATCFACHTAVKHADYVFTSPGLQ